MSQSVMSRKQIETFVKTERVIIHVKVGHP
jgi:hypothetical protein